MTSAPIVGAAKAKKRKQRDDQGPRKRRKSASWEDDSLLDLEVGVNRAFSSLDSQLLADYLSQKTGRFGTDLSSVELSDLYLPGMRPGPLARCSLGRGAEG